ncbi:uncharacterized protein I303_104164 [Kwoniella dejecticola CBS 10117]|uniref:WSC domain-containing protein n=1 Tax=Kwoniella dejecticola CBS 10117 TaxID=1296121 RepID=A0A1A6A631_9TREE|nr:uncharacterized protein I303_04858 [Kwoniella dejecticola CBS 10117]OBR85522.1 hypothetical protein I303_04858 [Kwoniella dejecticola CBS 10117]
MYTSTILLGLVAAVGSVSAQSASYTYVGAARLLPGTGKVVNNPATWNEGCQSACASSGFSFSYWKRDLQQCVCTEKGPLAGDLVDSFQQDANYFVVDVASTATWTACEEHLNSFTPVKTTTVSRPEECIASCAGYPGISSIATVGSDPAGSYVCSCYNSRINGYGGTSCKLGNIFVFYQSTPALTSGWSLKSQCIAEGSGGRALTGASTKAADMTWQKCTDFCDSKGFPIAGVEFSTECYCGAVLSNSASLTKTSSACTMKCSGDSKTTCGGSSALTLFVKDASVTGLSTDLTSKPVTLPAGWSAASSSCIAEGTSGRALASARLSAADMTIGKCLDFCQSKGWQYAGLEYANECYCGDQLLNGASLSNTLPASKCAMGCAGDQATTCGGSNSLQLYNNPDLALKNTINSGFTYQGCIKEVSGRALSATSVTTSDLTIDKCLDYCKGAGYFYAGLEYANECYCSNQLDNGASDQNFSNQCNMPCAGNSAQICGGPNAITLYAYAISRST